jgi:hypothetical protein
MRPPLSRSELRVLTMLECAAKTGGVMPSNQEIARVVGRKSISAGPKVLERLEDAGHIKVTRLARNGRIVAAANGSWSIANGYAQLAIARTHVGPPRLAEREAALAAPQRPKAPQSPARKSAERDEAGGRAAAGALPATRRLLVVDEAAPIPATTWNDAMAATWNDAVAARMRAEQEAGAREHMSTVGVQNLRAQIAALGARAGRPSRTCCYPMWPTGAPTPRPSIDWDPGRHFGPGVFCCDPVAGPGRSYCQRHHAITHIARAAPIENALPDTLRRVGD